MVPPERFSNHRATRCNGASAHEASVAGVVAGQGPEVADDEELQDGALTGYVVSVVGRRRFRRLHHIAKCGMLPGTDYKEFNWYGDVLPDPSLHDSMCSRCWRGRATFDAEAAGAAAELASVSSSGETATTVPMSEPA